MQRDLLDALRCPALHEESWLVAMVQRADGPILIEAELACPLCGAEYRVQQGEAWFRADSGSIEHRSVSAAPARADVERLAAQLGVMGGLAPVLLSGRYASMAADYATLTGAPVVIITAAADETFTEHPAVSVLRIDRGLPLGASTLAAAAFDVAPEVGPSDASASASASASALLAQVARAVRVGGRMLAPQSIVPMPAVSSMLRELARDDDEWVAELTSATSGLVSLRRSPPPV